MNIELSNNKLQYTGRIDCKNANKPEFIFPASALEFSFFGSKAILKIKNKNCYWDNYVGAIINGEQKTWKLNKDEITDIILVDGEKRKNTILFFKRMDSCHEIILEELILSDDSQLLELPEKPKRKIEVYGDSVSAGEVSEATEYCGKKDPEHNGEYSNSWYSYAWILARKLNAQLHNIAQGGIALINGTGWFDAPNYVGMESIWDKVHYNTQIAETTDWDFAKYTPNVVIIAIGQNDNNPKDYMAENIDCEKASYWRKKYKEFILNIRKKYENATIILTTTILNHNENWDKSIDIVCKDINDEKIFHFLYSKNGCGTEGHIRIPEAEQMASELEKFIENLPINVWE